MRHYFKLLAASLLVMNALTVQAGLLEDGLGSVLRGDTKNEAAKQDATPVADRSTRNLTVAATGSAGKRVALVIGNGNYQYADILPKLSNPTHDAEDIGNALRGFGFEVIEKENMSKEDMDAAITEFSRKIANSDAALFYFAGHGLQVKGQNYLIPVDAKIETEGQVPYKSINVNQVLEEMDTAQSRANIVILDACRNNPISGKFRSGATRGLAAPSSQPKGTVIVYATDPGNTAADGDGRNGLFTSGLLAAFKGSDLSLHGVLARASKEVERGSEKKQTPYVNGPMTLQDDFHFGQGTQVASLEPVPTPMPVPARIKTKEQIEEEYREGPAMVHIPGRNYEMGKYEVTQKEWLEVMGSNPSYFKNCGDTCPVESVSWNDVQEFISKLNAKTGRQYRLPSEAEWEYACYGGSQTEYCGGNNIDSVAWYYDNSGQTTHPVGQKQANGYGLYDMSGNVWEWQSDCYNGDCAMRALSGGSGVDGPRYARAAARDGSKAKFRILSFGFRLARTLP